MSNLTDDQQLARIDELIKVGRLAAGAAHEINNLLAPLLLRLERLDRELKHSRIPEAQRNRAAALDAALRIRTVVQDMLALAREGPHEPIPIDLNHVVTDACRLAKPTLDARARLVIESQRVPPVQANASQLVQLVLNLVLNAIDAFDESSFADNEVRVTVWSEDDHVCLQVSDNGRGMPPDVRERVFDAFFTTQGLSEGAGLGLWVCCNIARSHGGGLDVESELGRGTRVVLRLPVDTSGAPYCVARGGGAGP